ncbi:hypothetical protein HanXRQr2_Chr02g0056581 [Helianthus annuus]|uniref:Uncharacterized protein n=1 Tax=Helianthus annuus TaxID=4232 RepID=A0A9K3JLY7_HELAN|nr:uncharacterized protein LOC110888655 [Helianthus annuus]KAF5817740.1 hypothetical protein HanXRQr2_Chr02g0056581 [Helianthus annuus]
MDVAPATDFDFTFPSHVDTCYTSAPSSPTRLTELYHGFDKLFMVADANHSGSLATIPFAWEEKPGVPKIPSNLLEDDFTFDVSCGFDSKSVQQRERGRERGFSNSSRSRRTRSLSPLGSSHQWRPQVAPSSPAPSSEKNNESRKWSLLDLLLFRSSSDGRAMDRDPLKKYSANFRKYDQDIRNPGSVSKRRGRVSAHELHYNVNRAVSNDMKKKTYLPYKQGILGRFSFNP